jgi:hypothetical protein
LAAEGKLVDGFLLNGGTKGREGSPRQSRARAAN